MKSTLQHIALDPEGGGAGLKASGQASIQSAKVVFNGDNRPVAWLGGKRSDAATAQAVTAGSAGGVVP